MKPSELIIVRCKISRGGFGSERTYRVETKFGEHIGLAFWEYCFDNNYRPVQSEPDREIEGFIAGRIVRNGGDTAKVVFPDGEVCIFDIDKIVAAPSEIAKGVPV